jgi:hypothetical protein
LTNRPPRLQAGKIADHLDELGLDVRSRLTDIKVREIERLRDVVTKELELNKRPEGDHDVDGLQAAIDKHTAHIDVGELASFNKEDLRKLVMRVRIWFDFQSFLECPNYSTDCRRSGRTGQSAACRFQRVRIEKRGIETASNGWHD